MTLTSTYLAHLPETLNALSKADERWRQLRQGSFSVPQVISLASQPLRPMAVDSNHSDSNPPAPNHSDPNYSSPNHLNPNPSASNPSVSNPSVSNPSVSNHTSTYDVVVAGGTLGIAIAAALAMQGFRVAVLERGQLLGREQEWNISRHELQVLLDLQLLSPTELEQAISSEFNPIRIRFGETEIWTEDVLNLGVDPRFLLETLKQKFLAQGGILLEHCGFASAIVHPEGVEIHTTNGGVLSSRLVLDLMGHFSPITQQARAGKKPDAVCLVVGTCATGFPANTSGDLIASFTPIVNQCQYFWEAFPARDGRTTYLFTYLDADPDRISLTQLLDEYFRLLPEYQGVPLEQLTIRRALFGFFPCYKASPLQPTWDRILALGDSSGAQSPLSFGGFGAMMRHLERLTIALGDALRCDRLDAASLAQIQPYQPNLQVTWLFQKAMSVPMKQQLPPQQINQLLADVFQAMEQLGPAVLKPFLQDVVQFQPLLKTLLKTSLARPTIAFAILPQVGLLALLDWLVHFTNLAGYSLLNAVTSETPAPDLQALTTSEPQFSQPADRNARDYDRDRRRESWRYGSGGDYRGLE